jgi:3-oxoacyl-[acyl-carrier protein] reductase
MSTPPRTILITGASRGIGAAAAASFIAQGDPVVNLSRSPSPVSGVENHSCDLSDPASLESALDAVEAAHPTIDVVVANAGITRDQLSVRMSDEDFEAVIATNLTSTFRLLRRSLKKMIRQRSGRIVVVSSVGAYIGLPGQANYAASKAGLVGMARAMAREVASRGITINVIAPGMIATDMAEALGEERLGAVTSTIPAGRLGSAEEVAAGIVFLASPEASYVTGAVLAIDGGIGMGL